MKSERMSELQRTADTNVFVMMRYRQAPQFKEIEDAIRYGLSEYGLTARFAKDGAVVDDLWGNIEHYMRHSRYGIAVFEDIEERDFNPNISLELGFMYALRKRCLVLKEKRMPRLPTDMCGRIYRDFDSFAIGTSLRSQLRLWCRDDLGIVENRQDSKNQELIIFDSQYDDYTFSTWGTVSSDGMRDLHIKLQYIEGDRNSPEGTAPTMKLSSSGTEYVGLNKAIPLLKGRVRFEYKAVASSASNPNLLFCVIPMKGVLQDLIELGAEERAEPENAYSPHRERQFVPEAHIGDGEWHRSSITFDFTSHSEVTYSIFAPRINEGCPRPGPGELILRQVEILASEDDLQASPNTAIPPDVFRAAHSTRR